MYSVESLSSHIIEAEWVALGWGFVRLAGELRCVV